MTPHQVFRQALIRALRELQKSEPTDADIANVMMVSAQFIASLGVAFVPKENEDEFRYAFNESLGECLQKLRRHPALALTTVN